MGCLRICGGWRKKRRIDSSKQLRQKIELAVMAGDLAVLVCRVYWKARERGHFYRQIERDGVGNKYYAVQFQRQDILMKLEKLKSSAKNNTRKILSLPISMALIMPC